MISFRPQMRALGIVALAGSSFVHAETYAPLDISRVVAESDHIRIVRIIATEFDSAAPLQCRYRHRTEVLSDLKGSAPIEFYSGATAVVGSRYLLMGNTDSLCGDAGIAISLSGTSALYPILPYLIDVADEESWIAFGSAHFSFPAQLRTVEGNACYVATKGMSVNPCLVPFPAVNLTDFRQLLEGDVRK